MYKYDLAHLPVFLGPEDMTQGQQSRKTDVIVGGEHMTFNSVPHYQLSIKGMSAQTDAYNCGVYAILTMVKKLVEDELSPVLHHEGDIFHLSAMRVNLVLLVKELFLNFASMDHIGYSDKHINLVNQELAECDTTNAHCKMNFFKSQECIRAQAPSTSSESENTVVIGL